ncbi:MAG TPA: hypothetical protein VMU35_09735 [Methylomirabilota bacterium]|nr:hypothetical protein [Methylomirabilota bacterium]
MVRRFFHKERVIFLCEYCGFGYKDVETAETCEAFCGVHEGRSGKITRSALYTPHVMIIPLTN